MSLRDRTYTATLKLLPNGYWRGEVYAEAGPVSEATSCDSFHDAYEAAAWAKEQLDNVEDKHRRRRDTRCEDHSRGGGP